MFAGMQPATIRRTKIGGKLREIEEQTRETGHYVSAFFSPMKIGHTQLHVMEMHDP